MVYLGRTAVAYNQCRKLGCQTVRQSRTNTMMITGRRGASFANSYRTPRNGRHENYKLDYRNVIGTTKNPTEQSDMLMTIIRCNIDSMTQIQKRHGSPETPDYV